MTLTLGGGSGELLLVTEKEYWDELSKALQAEDWYGLAEMIAAGKAISVDNGSRAKVLDMGGFLAPLYKVRILEGQNQGRAGWIPGEFISP